jgi:xanthosine utilization system XapX-like protein
VIDDGDDSAARMAEALKPPESVPVHDFAGDMPRDIARDVPKDAARPPIRDLAQEAGIAKEPGRDAYIEALRERLRDPLRDPLREMLRDAAASRDPPREPPAAAIAADLAPRLELPPQVITVRSPGLTIVAVLIVLLGLIGGALLAWQLKLLQGEMRDLRATIAQNAKVADAAGRLSDAATQANEIANQSLANATRAWIGVDTVEAGTIQAGQSLTIEVRVRNSGRTPSTDMQGLFLVYISPIDNPPALLTKQCDSCVRSIMLPNGVVSYKLSVRDNVMTAGEVERIRDGKDTMWIVGRLDYRDGEGELHSTRSCLYYRTGGQPSFTACSDGNSAS